jgi:methyltransferase (TIGR00027 family)
VLAGNIGDRVTSRRLDRRASFTAQTCAARRAAETLQPPGRRLLDDPWSRHFVRDPFLRACLIHPLVARGFIGLLNYVYGAASHIFTVLRVRYTDDVRITAINDGIDQLVLLGAGFDTTTLRGAARSTVRIFEVDAPTTQAAKRAVIERLRPDKCNDQTVWVPCDFERDRLREKLLANGFDPTKRSLIAWIGVTGYLTEHAIDTTLADLAVLCARGSQLVVDYINPDVITDNGRPAGVRRLARARGSAARRGEPFRTRWTATDADALLASHGFQCCDHVRAPQLLQRYAPTHFRRAPTCGRLAITTAQRT